MVEADWPNTFKSMESILLRRSEQRVYFQQSLNSTVGKQIATDFVGFNWPWAVERQKDCKWGPLTSNLLLVGQGVSSYSVNQTYCDT